MVSARHSTTSSEPASCSWFTVLGFLGTSTPMSTNRPPLRLEQLFLSSRGGQSASPLAQSLQLRFGSGSFSAPLSAEPWAAACCGGEASSEDANVYCGLAIDSVWVSSACHRARHLAKSNRALEYRRLLNNASSGGVGSTGDAQRQQCNCAPPGSPVSAGRAEAAAAGEGAEPPPAARTHAAQAASEQHEKNERTKEEQSSGGNKLG